MALTQVTHAHVTEQERNNITTRETDTPIVNHKVSNVNLVTSDDILQPGYQQKVSNNIVEETIQGLDDCNGVSMSDQVESLDTILIWDSVNTRRDKMNMAKDVEIFRLWQQQTKRNFGFIPLSPLRGCYEAKHNKQVMCPLIAHNIVKNSGCFNFQKARICL